MKAKRIHLFQDIVMIIVSVTCALFFVESGLSQKFVASLGSLQLFGVLLAGIFFTSIFTTAPAIALLATLAETTSLPTLVIMGGIGAVLGDYVIFRFVKDRISKDFEYIFSFSRKRRYSAILKTRVFRFFVPFLAAVIIASPFPDEIGVALLGATKIKGNAFFALSFIANGAGILVIGWIAKTLSMSLG